jgi:magnesium-transporting ATPase (P-type)
MIMPSLKMNKRDKDEVQQKIDEHALEGFRTMVCAYRVLDRSEYLEFKKTMEELMFVSSQEDIYAIYNRYENNMEFLGTSAVEDELQEKVPELIYKLKEARIKSWILTGDKLETAIYVAKSCFESAKSGNAI